MHRFILFFTCACSILAPACTNKSNAPSDAAPSTGAALGTGAGAANGNTTTPAGSTSGEVAQGAQGTVVGPPLPTPTGTPAATPYVGTVSGPGNAYTFVGRVDTSVPALPRFSLPNSRVGGTFTGTSLGLLMTGNGSDSFSVVIDNGAEIVVTTAPTTAMTLYPVTQTLADGNHTAWITKRTEAREQSQLDPNVRTGAITFGGFSLAPGASMGAPPAPRSHLIITIGDSGFTGYGAGQLITPAQSCVFTPATQNATLSVPAKLADLLSAELINVSASGKGIAASAFDPANPNNQLPAMWQMLVPPNKTPVYPFEPLSVDAVIINGGSNDLVGNYGVGVIADLNVFISTYTALLADIRSHYPTALIVGLVTPNAIQSDKATLTQTITQAVAARTAAGDSRVFVYDYFAQDANNWQSYNDADVALNLGHGCQGHPSGAGAAFLADRLATFLRLKQAAP